MTCPTLLITLAVVAIACGKPSPNATATADETPAVASVESVSDAGRIAEAPQQIADAAPIPAIAPSADASPPKPEVTLKTSKSWPFFAWDTAQSYTFNRRRPGPGARLRVYSEPQGWTHKPVKGPALSASQAKKALRLLAKTEGQLIVSKCPFPRHGIVFFQNDVPVGSISVCFECGDIMIWPRYRPDPGWQERKQKRYPKLMKAYDRVFPKWEALFEKELSLPTDWKKQTTLMAP